QGRRHNRTAEAPPSRAITRPLPRWAMGATMVGPMNLPSCRVACLAGLFLTACGGGGGSSDPIGDVPPELLACRARFDTPSQFAEVALRSSQNLGSSRIADRTGTERHARLHQERNTVVFSRERRKHDPDRHQL